MDVDYYEILGVPPGPSVARIKAAYRAAAKRLHPDAGGNPALFRLVQEAHQTLADPATRAAYDRSRTGSQRYPAPTAITMPRDAAVTLLQQTGLSPTWKFRLGDGSDVVMAQEPGPGVALAPGASVGLTISYRVTDAARAVSDVVSGMARSARQSYSEPDLPRPARTGTDGPSALPRTVWVCTTDDETMFCPGCGWPFEFAPNLTDGDPVRCSHCSTTGPAMFHHGRRVDSIRKQVQPGDWLWTHALRIRSLASRAAWGVVTDVGSPIRYVRIDCAFSGPATSIGSSVRVFGLWRDGRRIM